MEKLEPASGPSDHAQEQQRRALEVLIAGRYAEAISDPATWSSPFGATHFSKNQRMIAERALATHPDPSAKEVSQATESLQPFLDEMPDGPPGVNVGAIPLPAYVVITAVGFYLVLTAVPSVICALLFRGGLLMYIFGIAVVTKNGSRASRLRTFWRSLVAWSPCVLLPLLFWSLIEGGIAQTWSMYLSMAVLIAIVAWSVSMPVRGIPDRIAGTYPVPP
jgi:hypothetical protein